MWRCRAARRVVLLSWVAHSSAPMDVQVGPEQKFAGKEWQLGEADRKRRWRQAATEEEKRKRSLAMTRSEWDLDAEWCCGNNHFQSPQGRC